jgi:hypothetical protein
LYAVRLTNRAFHNLIHENESTIVRKYLSQELESLQEYFKPAGAPSLNYRIELRYRLRNCRRLSSLLAGRCCVKLKTRPQLDDHDSWRRRKSKKLEDKLMMSMFALYEFLARFRQVVIRSLHEFEGCSTTDFARLGFVLGLDQQRIFECFPSNSLVGISQAWRILEGIATRKGVPFSCASTKYPYTTVKALLVLGGLDRFLALISKTNLEEHMQDLDNFNAEIWQDRTWKPRGSLVGSPLSSIHHLAAPPKCVSAADFPTNMSPTAPITFINCQHVCEPSLTAVTLRLARNLDSVMPVDHYICDAVKEEGDPSYRLLPWNLPSPA